MKIKNIKINAYGNIENRELNLKDNINIIHGENESGKSTLLSYIVNTLYGISKNKDGKEVSDYDKYKPWNNQEYSGKLSYELQNGEQYEIFRDFNKKNPKIYNSKLEDVTANFDTDKKEGSKFFVEQTGIDKQTYLSTVVSMQQEVRLEEKDQNILIQKIANLASSGEDNVSYKKAIQKLQEKIKDEIGTNKTAQKPINLIEKEINEISIKIEEIRPYQNRKYEIDGQKEEINYELEKLKIKKEILKELKENLQDCEMYKKEINIKENNKKQDTIKIGDLNDEKSKLEEQLKIPQKQIEAMQLNIESHQKEQEKVNQEIDQINEKIKQINIEKQKTIKKNPLKMVALFGLLAFIIWSVLTFTMIKNNSFTIIGIIGVLSFLVMNIVIVKKERKSKREQENKKQKYVEEKSNEIKILEEKKQEINTQLNEIQLKINQEKEKEININNNLSMLIGQIMLLNKNNEQIEKELNETISKLENINNKKVAEIKQKYSIEIPEELLNKDVLDSKINQNEEEINNKTIKTKELEIEEKNILQEVERLASYEERLELDKEKYKELRKNEEIINIAISNLQEAYEEMKTTITPKFTNSLSNSIKKISDNKYNRVTINDENGMIVENSRGEYIEAMRLSTGTIDQLYLSLRLSMVDELTKENLPIILDETFAYFDDERLANSLKFIYESLNGHQAIIFTCTNREKEILEKLGIDYNAIEL